MFPESFVVDQRTETGRNPLSLAAESGDVATTKSLLERVADVEAADRDGWTPLIWAADDSQEAAVRRLWECIGPIHIAHIKSTGGHRCHDDLSLYYLPAFSCVQAGHGPLVTL